jgi:hypothetical protein
MVFYIFGVGNGVVKLRNKWYFIYSERGMVL